MTSVLSSALAALIFALLPLAFIVVGDLAKFRARHPRTSATIFIAGLVLLIFFATFSTTIISVAPSDIDISTIFAQKLPFLSPCLIILLSTTCIVALTRWFRTKGILVQRKWIFDFFLFISIASSCALPIESANYHFGPPLAITLVYWTFSSFVYYRLTKRRVLLGVFLSLLILFYGILLYNIFYGSLFVASVHHPAPNNTEIEQMIREKAW